MDLNVPIFLFDIGFVQENISAGTLEMAMCCQNCSTWFPLRTDDHVIPMWSQSGRRLVNIWSQSGHQIVPKWSKLSLTCYKVATK